MVRAQWQKRRSSAGSGDVSRGGERLSVSAREAEALSRCGDEPSGGSGGDLPPRGQQVVDAAGPAGTHERHVLSDAASPAPVVGFAASDVAYGRLTGFLGGEESGRLSHVELEQRLRVEGAELLRQLFQDHLDVRAGREQRPEAVLDANGSRHGAVETGHARALQTVFGTVTVRRLAYRHKGEENLYPADAALNLPEELHSHGLRALAAIEASRGSFEEAADAVERATGVRAGKRQVEALAQRAAVDFEAFYEGKARTDAAAGSDVLVLSADGKGIVMRPEALRAATAKAATKSTNKLKTRLSKGEKTNRKRMAEVAAVYDVTPVARVPADIIAARDDTARAEAPKATNKWLSASVVDDAAGVISAMFDEATRRDPEHQRTWIALVDGACHQIERIKAEGRRRGVTVTIVVDFVHVMEYLWSAAWSFFDEGDPAAEAWVADKATAILEAKASTVAASIRRKATRLHLDPAARTNADRCSDYLLAKAPYLRYDQALAQGWPIATGVIEGAVRHLVKDRLDLTGSRWGLKGAEAVLKLRALRTNGDFDEYFAFHLDKERQRVHAARYANGVIPVTT
ncbi:MAG: ISKra4 family transposase [Actinomycetota bacterium]|nr:ISKra4 family transposase [Actinomycetota bacterium]